MSSPLIALNQEKMYCTMSDINAENHLLLNDYMSLQALNMMLKNKETIRCPAKGPGNSFERRISGELGYFTVWGGCYHIISKNENDLIWQIDLNWKKFAVWFQSQYNSPESLVDIKHLHH